MKKPKTTVQKLTEELKVTKDPILGFMAHQAMANFADAVLADTTLHGKMKHSVITPELWISTAKKLKEICSQS